MPFQKFVCWKPARVRHVMDTEALQTPNHVFLATHSPITMYLQSLTDIDVKEPYNEQKFLNDFLDTPTPDFAFVPVLGTAGTGKSHLIRWLAANIPETPNRKVLLIPRAGTNLKDIIERILNVIDHPRTDEYRSRLARAANILGEEEARGHLLNNLANLIEYGGPTENASEAEIYVAEQLPALLYDVYFRRHLLSNGKIIESLVTHVIGRKDSIEVIDERRSFTINDLPLNMADYEPSRVGETARDFYSFLIGDDETRKVTVNLMNHYLDAAIAHMLQLNREDLENLMRDVRKTLAEQGIELILLIEDFAKLQGIDRQVLATVIERPEEPGRPRLCALRTALACTTGYFDSLKDTVRQRTTFSVNLDVEVGDNALIRPGDISSFVSRYLNAARLKDSAILEWYESRNDNEGMGVEPVPIRCENCPHKDPCHTGFGSVNGIGLYPFTSKALERMYARVETQGRFNPRKVIRDVLRHTLENYATSLEDGQFPPQPLLQHFGGSKIGAGLRRQIEMANPANHSRREVLIDLWSDGNKLVNFDQSIHQAFDLPPLGNVSALPTAATQPIMQRMTAAAPVQQSAAYPERLEGLLRQLDDWANGVRLPQDVAEKLRPLVYKAVVERIEWDAELLLRGKFVGEKGVFRQPNVGFANSTQPSIGRGVELTLAADTDTAIALQAILKHNHHGGWNYNGGAADFRVYAKQLETWGRYVVERIRTRARTSGDLWDPVPAAAELLALGTRMSNQLGGEGSSLTDLVGGLFSIYDPSTVSNGRSAKWQQLFNLLCQNRQELIDIVSTYAPCTKGGHSSLQVIDAVQLVNPLKAIRKTWRPQCEIPNDLRTDFKIIEKVREKVDQLLDDAIEEETKRHIDWRNEVISMIGSVNDRGMVIELLRTAIDKAKSSGDFAAGGIRPDELLDTIGEFERAHLDRCVTAIKKIEQETDSGRLLEELSRVPQETMVKTRKFLAQSKEFLDRSTARVKMGIDNLRQSGGTEFESSQQAIRESIGRLHQLTNELKEERNDR